MKKTVLCLASLAVVLSLPALAGAEETVVSRPASGAAETLKQGRVVPGGVSPQTGTDRPLISEPAPVEPGQKSGGLTLLERMGASLPPLPPEKPFTGRVDEAYGAYQRGLYVTAMELALPRAQLGDPAAQTLLGELISNGLGVRKDLKAAAFWYQQAADHGDPGAMFRMAMLLMEGDVVKQDKAKADALMRKAADAGNAAAAFNLAQIIIGEGKGPESLKKAMPYYRTAAEAGIPDAQYALSQIYMSLPEVGADHKQQAEDWIRKAALQRFDTAELDLGLWLVNGTLGKRDYDAGFRWLRRAALQGNISAANKLAHLYINALGTRPDPVEAAKWYVISRRAGLPDPMLEDFFLGIEEDQQQKAVEAADAFRPRR